MFMALITVSKAYVSDTAWEQDSRCILSWYRCQCTCLPSNTMVLAMKDNLAGLPCT
jgi:hypothetical protein